MRAVPMAPPALMVNNSCAGTTEAPAGSSDRSTSQQTPFARRPGTSFSHGGVKFPVGDAEGLAGRLGDGGRGAWQSRFYRCGAKGHSHCKCAVVVRAPENPSMGELALRRREYSDTAASQSPCSRAFGRGGVDVSGPAVVATRPVVAVIFVLFGAATAPCAIAAEIRICANGPLCGLKLAFQTRPG